METPLPSASSVPKGNRSPCAFSLVEIAIAMGIVSFALIALLGLMTVSMGASKRSYEDTTVASLAQTVVSQVKTNDYAIASNLSLTNYFSYDGFPTNAQNSYFQCNVQVLTHTNADLPAAARKSTAGSRLRLTFIWDKRTNEIFETSIARY